MELKSDYKLKEFRTAFVEYIKKVHPEWAERTVTTKASDAFILVHKDSKEEKFLRSNNIAWNRTLTEEKQVLRSDIESMLSHRKDCKSDASGYIKAIEELREFVFLVSCIEKAREKSNPRTIQKKDDV